MRRVLKEKDEDISIENTKKGKDLKLAYLQKIEKPGAKVRMFCLGQEIASHKRLYTYGISKDYVIICFFVK